MIEAPPKGPSLKFVLFNDPSIASPTIVQLASPDIMKNGLDAIDVSHFRLTPF